MRIVSLMPAATQIVVALGLSDTLVGETGEPNAGEYVRAALGFSDVKPDLAIVPGVRDRNGDTREAFDDAVKSIGAAQVLSLEATSLAGVLDDIRRIGAAVEREAEAEALARGMQERWDRVREQAAGAPERPRTLLLGEVTPPGSAGRWNPELLEMAGATAAPWDVAGEPSRAVAWEDIVAFAPETIVLIPRGRDANAAVDEAEALVEKPGWYDLPAVRAGECYTADGRAFFHRPGPSLAESAEILATILHPETFTEMLPPYSVRIFPPSLLERPKE